MDTDNNEMQMSLFDEPKEDKCYEEHGEKKLTLIKPKGSKKPSRKVRMRTNIALNALNQSSKM